MSAFDKPKIIIIDNDKNICSEASELLKSEFMVYSFIDANDAIKSFDEMQVNLVICEIELEGSDGFSVYEKLRRSKLNAQTSMIILSKHLTDEIQAKAFKAGIVDVIGKPIKPPIFLLRARLNVMINLYKNNLQSIADEQIAELISAYQNLTDIEDTIIDLLATLIEYRENSNYTNKNCLEEYIKILIDEMNKNPRPGYEISDALANDIIKSSKLHDIGMIGISDDILLKAGKLTEYEFDIIRKHTVIGEKMLEEAIESIQEESFLNTTKEIAASHHEKWNGEGYPYRIKGEDIPLSARIMALIDVYDVLISARPYRKAISHTQATRLIMEGYGNFFDPYLVDMFLAANEKFDIVNVKYRESNV